MKKLLDEGSIVMAEAKEGEAGMVTIGTRDLDKVSQAMKETIHILEERLKPVLIRAKEGEGDKVKEIAESVPLAEDLERITDQLKTSRCTLQGLLDRIQL